MNHSNEKGIAVAIVGAGSIGCYLGGCLASGCLAADCLTGDALASDDSTDNDLASDGSAVTQARVTLIGRPRIQQQINDFGLHLTDWRGRNTHINAEQVVFSLAISAIVDADYILVTVKSGDTAEVAASIAHYAKPSAVIVSFQNGVRNLDTLTKYLPDHTVLKGMVPFNVLSQGQGHFHCGTEGNLAIEDRTTSSASLIAALHSCELPVDQYADLRGIQWSKLLMNLNNAINALSGVPLQEQLQDRQYRKVLALAIKEALMVLRAAGIKPVKTGKVIPVILPTILSLPNYLFTLVAASMLKMDPQARSSMYEDLTLKRKTEIDYINGEIVKLGETVNVNTPINSAITKLIKNAEQDNNGSPLLSSTALYQTIKS